LCSRGQNNVTEWGASAIRMLQFTLIFRKHAVAC
jgi:hypothetical protein